MDDDLAN